MEKDENLDVLIAMLHDVGYDGGAEMLKKYVDRIPPFTIGDDVFVLKRDYLDGVWRFCKVVHGKISMLTQKADKSWVLRYTYYSPYYKQNCTDSFKESAIGDLVYKDEEEAKSALAVLLKKEGNDVR